MTSYPLLDTIATPAQLRALDRKQLAQLSEELRSFLVESVSRTGGHLSSNLGTVELTIALHYVFDTPHDRLIWDVGHQTYAHKVLTGRRAEWPSYVRMAAFRASQTRRERIRHLWRRAFFHLDFRCPRHGSGHQAQG